MIILTYKEQNEKGKNVIRTKEFSQMPRINHMVFQKKELNYTTYEIYEFHHIVDDELVKLEKQVEDLTISDIYKLYKNIISVEFRDNYIFVTYFKNSDDLKAYRVRLSLKDYIDITPIVKGE